MWKWLLCSILLLSMGCNALENAASSPDGKYARGVLNDLSAKRTTSIREQLVDDLRTSETFDKIEHVARTFPNEAPRSVQLIGFRSVKKVSTEEAVSTATFDSAYSTAHLVTTIVVRSASESRLVQGLNVQLLPEPVDEINAFTFREAGFAHWAILALAVANIGLSVGSTIVWFRARKSMPKRWLWLAAILLGVGGIVVNWQTGQIERFDLTLQFFGASYQRMGLYGPWAISASLPIGAILFLRKRRSS